MGEKLRVLMGEVRTRSIVEFGEDGGANENVDENEGADVDADVGVGGDEDERERVRESEYLEVGVVVVGGEVTLE